MRSARHWLGWGALLIAVTACLGGQTGQPTSLDDCSRSVAPNQAVAGVTPDSFVAAFEGTHVATLEWNVAEAPADDEITIELRRAANHNATDNCGYLNVTVHVELSTRDHGVLTSRSATLRGLSGQLEQASLRVDGERTDVAVDFVAADGQVRISGTLTTSDAVLPAPTATFPGPDGLSGAGGGEG